MPDRNKADEQGNRRTPLSKRLRFEVLKRDSFKCQYCGASAPNVLLHVDHIKPVSAGGADDLTNLITACTACNLGKSNRALSDHSALTKRKEQLDGFQQRREQIEMMMQWTEELQDLDRQTTERIADYWAEVTAGYSLSPNGLQHLRKWMLRFPIEAIVRAMDIAATQYLVYEDGGVPSQESVEKAFLKVPGILTVQQQSRENPDLRELMYIRGILRNNCPNYFNDAKALQLLKNARNLGISLPTLKGIALETYNWTSFVKMLESEMEVCMTSDQD